MKNVFLGLLFSAVLAGCNQVVVDQHAKNLPPSVGSYSLTPDDKTIIENGVRQSLKDPDSAKFGPMQASKRSDGAVTVCGYVNAKNSFGGYVGMQPFIGLLSKEPDPVFGVSGMGGTDTKTMVVKSFCKKSGIEI